MGIAKKYISLKTLGPGLLYAGAAIGVSHLVQSTRGGANFGLTLIPVILIIHCIKYPLFIAAPHLSGKNENLLDHYKGLGEIHYYLFIGFSMISMPIALGAILLVTTGLLTNIFQGLVSFELCAVALAFLVAAILWFGKLRVLNRLVKYIVLLLAALSLISLMILMPNSTSSQWQFGTFNISADMAFLVAFLGWMPAPIDIVVWQSLWYQDDTSGKNNAQRVIDFKVGYWGTAVMACVFLLLGSLTLFGKPLSLEASAVGFTKQFINIYTATLGQWVYPIIALAAFATMLSTSLTCTDAYPRVLAHMHQANQRKYYKLYVLVAVVLSLVLALFFAQDMKGLIDFITHLSFVAAPVFGYWNFKLLLLKRPQFATKTWFLVLGYAAIICLAAMAAFSLIGLDVW